MKIILASNSPRRKQLLFEQGFSFEVMASDYEEQSFSSDPVLTATAFAEGKAKDVFNRLKNKDEYVVLGADTVVYLSGEILGKPNNETDARAMLKKLSGKTHSVITGYYLISGSRALSGYVETPVTFNDLSDSIIDEYLASGLYKGKAGSYGIQDNFPLVKTYDGSLSNVIGLPVERITPILKEFLK